MIDTCPLCALSHQIEAMRERKKAERIALKRCWLDGGIVNDSDQPTTIRIDRKILKEDKAALLALLKKIEHS